MTKDTGDARCVDPGASGEQSDPSQCFVQSTWVSHAYDVYVREYDAYESACPYVCENAHPCKWCPYAHPSGLRSRTSRPRGRVQKVSNS